MGGDQHAQWMVSRKVHVHIQYSCGFKQISLCCTHRVLLNEGVACEKLNYVGVATVILR